MFAIAFDLDYQALQLIHPKGVRQAYKTTLQAFGFRRSQQSLDACETADLRALIGAVAALKALPWLPGTVSDLRGFRLENWSDFTPFIKGSKP